MCRGGRKEGQRHRLPWEHPQPAASPPPGGITVLGGWPVRKEAPLPVCLLFLQCNWDVEGADGGLDHNRSHGCSGVAVMRGRGSVGSAFFLPGIIWKALYINHLTS